MQDKKQIIFAGDGEDLSLLICGDKALPRGLDLPMAPVEEQESFELYYCHECFENKLYWIRLTELKELSFGDGALVCQALGKFWPFMPENNPQLAKIVLPKLFFKEINWRAGVVFFGGSFNPWHVGHRTCLELYLQASAVEQLVVVPDSNPWKEQRNSACFWREYYQLAQQLEELPVAIYSGFWGMEHANPTVSWLPQTRLPRRSLLMGDDLFFELRKWHKSEELLKSLDGIYVVPRAHKLSEIRSYSEQFSGIEIDILPEHSFCHISSSQIRNKFDE